MTEIRETIVELWFTVSSESYLRKTFLILNRKLTENCYLVNYCKGNTISEVS